MPSAVASATARIAAACPSASLICCCFFASDALMTCCFSPSALLIAASRWPRGEDHGALLALGPHLLLHGGEHVGRRCDVLDLVAQHLDAPRLGRLVELVHHLEVDVRALLEGAVELDLADLAAQRRLRELGDREEIVRHAVGGPLGIHHLQVEDAVDVHLDVVLRDADLLRDIEGILLERVAVADPVDEGEEDVEARVERGPVAAEPLDHERALLRHDDGGTREDEEDQDRQHQEDDQRARQHVPSYSG